MSDEPLTVLDILHEISVKMGEARMLAKVYPERSERMCRLQAELVGFATWFVDLMKGKDVATLDREVHRQLEKIKNMLKKEGIEKWEKRIGRNNRREP